MPSTAGPPDPVPDAGLTATLAPALPPGGRLAGPLHAFAAVDSTQAVARRLAEAGASEGTLVVADFQRAGRGQRGRSWTAPAGAGLLLSVVLRPPLAPARWPALTLLAAGAVVDAVARVAPGVRAEIRPPNDVFAGGRKLAGILAESVVGPRPFVVLGIGINVGQRPEDWPAELRGRAVSLAELGAPVGRPALLAALLDRLAERYAAFVREPAALAPGAAAG